LFMAMSVRWRGGRMSGEEGGERVQVGVGEGDKRGETGAAEKNRRLK
jgi:hypothetical protein